MGERINKSNTTLFIKSGLDNDMFIKNYGIKELLDQWMEKYEEYKKKYEETKEEHIKTQISSSGVDYFSLFFARLNREVYKKLGPQDQGSFRDVFN